MMKILINNFTLRVTETYINILLKYKILLNILKM